MERQAILIEKQGQIGALWGIKRAGAIAAELGISKSAVYRCARRMRLRRIQFLKGYTCRSCGKQWNPKLVATRAKSYSRRCPECIQREGPHYRLEAQQRAYEMFLAGRCWKAIAKACGYGTGHTAEQCVLRFARLRCLPWPDRAKIMRGYMQAGLPDQEITEKMDYASVRSMRQCRRYYRKIGKL